MHFLFDLGFDWNFGLPCVFSLLRVFRFLFEHLLGAAIQNRIDENFFRDCFSCVFCICRTFSFLGNILDHLQS